MTFLLSCLCDGWKAKERESKREREGRSSVVKTPLTPSASHFSLALLNSSLFLHSSILLYPSRDPGGLQVRGDTPAAGCCPRTRRHHRLGISFDRVSDSIITSGGVRALREPVNPPKSHPSTQDWACCQIRHGTYTPQNCREKQQKMR